MSGLKFIIVAGLFLALSAGFFSLLGIGFDSTDDLDNRSRSGIGLRIDHATGCQYLVTPEGSITQRMGPDGRQLCAARKS
jgi:hypothetical protein